MLKNRGSKMRSLVLTEEESRKVLEKLVDAIVKANPKGDDTVLIGIQTGGVAVAECLAKRLAKRWGFTPEVGHLDIAMHRDDLGQKLAPLVHPTYIPFDITGKRVLLVDDVLCSGRTSRAALDALTDLGRPSRVELAVFIERAYRELPIRADFVGRFLETQPSDHVEVEVDPQREKIRVYVIQHADKTPQE